MHLDTVDHRLALRLERDLVVLACAAGRGPGVRVTHHLDAIDAVGGGAAAGAGGAAPARRAASGAGGAPASRRRSTGARGSRGAGRPSGAGRAASLRCAAARPCRAGRPAPARHAAARAGRPGGAGGPSGAGGPGGAGGAAPPGRAARADGVAGAGRPGRAAGAGAADHAAGAVAGDAAAHAERAAPLPSRAGARGAAGPGAPHSVAGAAGRVRAPVPEEFFRSLTGRDIETGRQGQKGDGERVAGNIKAANKRPPRASLPRRAEAKDITVYASRISSWNGDIESGLTSQRNIDRTATYSAAAISARCRGNASMSTPCQAKPGTPREREIRLPEASRSLMRQVRSTTVFIARASSAGGATASGSAAPRPPIAQESQMSAAQSA